MQLSTIRTNVKNSLEEDGVHRSDAFIDTAINEGYKLVALLSLSDERRTSLDINGSRNFCSLPTATSSYCFAPLYITNTNTGTRITPSRLDQFELYNERWEGKTDSSGDSLYYVYFNPYHESEATLVVCPIANIGRSQFTLIGAFIPAEMVADSDVPRLAEQFQDILFHYARFYTYMGEPGRSDDALECLQTFLTRLNDLITSIKARFPSGRDYEPFPIEFTYEAVTEQQQKEQMKNES